MLYKGDIKTHDRKTTTGDILWRDSKAKGTGYETPGMITMGGNAWMGASLVVTERRNKDKLVGPLKIVKGGASGGWGHGRCT